MSTTLGIIIGNRDFFPDHLITEARNEILSIFKNKKINPILLGDNDTKLGGVETFLEAQKCANLFKAHQEEIEGILVILPNFGGNFFIGTRFLTFKLVTRKPKDF